MLNLCFDSFVQVEKRVAQKLQGVKKISIESQLNRADTDRDSKISKREFRAVLVSLLVDLSDKDFKLLWHCFDPRDSGNPVVNHLDSSNTYTAMHAHPIFWRLYHDSDIHVHVQTMLYQTVLGDSITIATLFQSFTVYY